MTRLYLDNGQWFYRQMNSEKDASKTLRIKFLNTYFCNFYICIILSNLIYDNKTYPYGWINAKD